MGAFALTEPEAGTDAGSLKTSAVQVAGGYILNGKKRFITNARYADLFVVMAMTDMEKSTKGISAFIVERNFPGVCIGKKVETMGIRGSAASELVFEDVFVPDVNLLGKEGQGFDIALKTLDGGRITIGAQALGIASGALEETVGYTKQRKQFDRNISDFQNTRFVLADMMTRIEAARLLVYKAAECKCKGLPFRTEAAQAKLFASETAMDVTTKAVQLHGGYGYTKECPVERMMRDAKITEIYEGTNEVQRMVISGELIKRHDKS